MSPWTRAFMEHRSHLVALVVAAILAASLLQPTPAQATLSRFEVTINLFVWTDATPPPFPVLDGFEVRNTLDIKLATDTGISSLFVKISVSDPGVGITFIEGTVFPTNGDALSYNNYEFLIGLTFEGALAWGP